MDGLRLDTSYDSIQYLPGVQSRYKEYCTRSRSYRDTVRNESNLANLTAALAPPAQIAPELARPPMRRGRSSAADQRDMSSASLPLNLICVNLSSAPWPTARALSKHVTRSRGRPGRGHANTSRPLAEAADHREWISHKPHAACNRVTGMVSWMFGRAHAALTVISQRVPVPKSTSRLLRSAVLSRHHHR